MISYLYAQYVINRILPFRRSSSSATSSFISPCLPRGELWRPQKRMPTNAGRMHRAKKKKNPPAPFQKNILHPTATSQQQHQQQQHHIHINSINPLVPALSQRRERARRASCISNTRCARERVFAHFAHNKVVLMSGLCGDKFSGGAGGAAKGKRAYISTHILLLYYSLYIA